MNSILLHPSDVLFFRDGRPMVASLAGHGAAWPLPNVISHAFHAALHRAELGDVHTHGHYAPKGSVAPKESRKFGSLATAGPFPVHVDGGSCTWYFPRPADALWPENSSEPIILSQPVHNGDKRSSLPDMLRCACAATVSQDKSKPAGWWSEAAWNRYLGTSQRESVTPQLNTCRDDDFSDAEYTYGIGINFETGSVEEGLFYSASYLRLKEKWRLGVFAKAPDATVKERGNDLVCTLLDGFAGRILVGGQQRVCTAKRDDTVRGRLPLPLGQAEHFTVGKDGKCLVKWVLLTPALWPEIAAKPGDESIHPHRGGWLPNWIAEKEIVFEGNRVKAGSVLLLDGPGRDKAKRKRLTPGQRIAARLVAAIVPKPIPVTGWALPNAIDRPEGGAKSTHLAVPAGAVYYFEADSEEAARLLARALNWHGSDATLGTIINRRSTLMGEKGFGLGACGTWDFHSGIPPRSEDIRSADTDSDIG